ncbi:hypothetical protein SCHPADRAFT_573692 [Schizopora paradoxa]|uniref:DUF6533 domain-containing protein n=1 Tax=Schizopora paradoxa TaxID=27342 RepID=A0A0H2RCM0_9AGAM|nr:hypothetical protein SCHPADRAFT_573692 [Schizopora paradoxa]
MDSETAGDPLKPLREAFEWTYFLDRARTGYVCLIVYDIILCFPRELESIWKSRWSSGKLLYLSCRYVALLYLVFVCMIFQNLTDCSAKVYHLRKFSVLGFDPCVYTFSAFSRDSDVCPLQWVEGRKMANNFFIHSICSNCYRTWRIVQ